MNATDIEVSGVLRSNTIQSDTTDADINISSQGTGVVGISSQLTLTGSFLPAIHTFVATDAVTITEHAGRTLLLGEVGGNAAVTLTLPAATGTGAVYKFIVSVTNTSNYKIQGGRCNRHNRRYDVVPMTEHCVLHCDCMPNSGGFGHNHS